MYINIFTNKNIEILFSKKIKSTNELPKIPYATIQKHTDKVFVVKEKTDIRKKYISDAIITNIKKLPIGVKTADCVPILIYDPNKNVIATVHSGWRGTLKKIAIKTIHKMSEIYGSKSQNILISMGPAICGKCYFVDNNLINEFKKIFKFNFYTQKNNIFYIDLREINKKILTDIGVKEKNIFIHPDCTYCKNEEYQSYRYHKNTLSFQISYIMIK